MVMAQKVTRAFFSLNNDIDPSLHNNQDRDVHGTGGTTDVSGASGCILE
jgi:hypothetical protein